MFKRKIIIIAVSALAAAPWCLRAQRQRRICRKPYPPTRRWRRHLCLGRVPWWPRWGANLVGTSRDSGKRPHACLHSPRPRNRRLHSECQRAFDWAVTKPQKNLAPKGGGTQTDDVFGSIAIPFKKLGALKKAAPTFAEIAKGTALKCGGVTASIRMPLCSGQPSAAACRRCATSSTLVNPRDQPTDQVSQGCRQSRPARQWSLLPRRSPPVMATVRIMALLKMAVLEARHLASGQ